MDKRKLIFDATAAAARLHRDLKMQRAHEANGGNIDVFSVFEIQHLPLLFRPLDGLLGAYITAPCRGVLVTTRRSLSVQRFTAAHELGHFILNHSPSLDDDNIIRRASGSSQGLVDQEFAANMFAAAFLFPQWLLVGFMKRLGLGRKQLSNPHVVYQLALRLGISYEAVCYGLRQYDLVSQKECGLLVETERKKLKQQLAEGYTPENWRIDVWRLTERDNGSRIEGGKQDVIRFDLHEHSDGGFVWDLSDLQANGFSVLLDERHNAIPEEEVGANVTRSVAVRSDIAEVGRMMLAERRPWQSGAAPLQTLSVGFALAGPVREGLLPQQKAARIGVA